MSNKFKNQIAEVKKEYPLFYHLTFGALVVIILVIIGWYLLGTDNAILTGNSLAYFSNLWISGVSISAGIFVIDQVNRKRDRDNADKAEKKNLIIRLRSEDRAEAMVALDMLLAKGWLSDGTLNEAFLLSAQLENATLLSIKMEHAVCTSANFKHAAIPHAKLKGTTFDFAELQEATLFKADLRNTRLVHANMAHSNLSFSILENAILIECNLKGAILTQANLKNAEWIHDAHFDNTTVLPDAKYLYRNSDGVPIFDKYWSPSIDMTRYSNPKHPDFWQPEWVEVWSKQGGDIHDFVRKLEISDPIFLSIYPL